MIKGCIELHEVARAACAEVQLMYLSGPQQEDGIVFYRMRYEVDLMNAAAFFYGEQKVEVVPVQIVHQVGTTKNKIERPDVEPAQVGRPGCGFYLADGDIFHVSDGGTGRVSD
jgi:hypothetical protein